MRSAELDYLIGHSEIGLAVTLPERAGRPARRGGRGGRRAATSLTPEAVADVPPARGRRRARGRAARRGHRVRAALHLGHHRPAQGLRADQRATSCARATGTPASAACARVRPRRRARDHAAAAEPHERDGLLDHGGDPRRAAASSQLDRFHPEHLVAAACASRGATIVHYLGVMPAMLLSAPPARGRSRARVRFGFGAGVDRSHHAPFEAALRLPAARGLGDDRDRRRPPCIIANREPRHVGTSCFGRAEPDVEAARLVDDAGPRRRRRHRPASCWCARPAPIRGAASSAAT